MEYLRPILVVSAFAIALTGAMFSARSVQAANPPDFWPTWAKWEMQLTPSGNDYSATWHVSIGGEDKAGDPFLLHTEAIPLNCRTIDGVSVQNSVMTFKGGYIECDFPSLIETANEIIIARWGKQYMLHIGPDCNCMPIKDAYATLNGQMNEEGDASIFEHPSIRFGLIQQGKAVANRFEVSGELSQGDYGPIGQQASYESRYRCDKGQGVCFFDHLQSGVMVSMDKRNYRTANFYTSAVTVTIGHDPKTGDTFYGSLTDLTVDPGCRAN